MIDGVRMRLLVTVWNSTVEEATATPTRLIPITFLLRNSRTKLHGPRAPTVMNSTTAAAAASASTTSTTTGGNAPQRRLSSGAPPGRSATARVGGAGATAGRPPWRGPSPRAVSADTVR